MSGPSCPQQRHIWTGGTGAANPAPASGTGSSMGAGRLTPSSCDQLGDENERQQDERKGGKKPDQPVPRSEGVSFDTSSNRLARAPAA